MPPAKTVHIIPTAGLKVRDPKGGHLPPTGADVDAADPYWRRRLRAGDVAKSAAIEKPFEIADGDAAKPAPAPTKAPTKAPAKAKESGK
ncbi:DUF2635 domain-containing protein [Varunaivibrio sulfuroxidans]|uniref:Uncharacterized protein DUF2635 n=1 Tax=Varunaivibrio sulfuroxidans TaxID=1773489 RepID=A0A4R3JBC1_9PROT|nr:DUF2635 domain-containing protein [Varunaivibrio sulfuroxidans]TCS62585.1 uncharacterized protein DUF2635 [Varunaivibrio sulfuroxidans]WES30746.1 DUF2635 domain-containing protein [Varunaivibrio sulfuroxidans]